MPNNKNKFPEKSSKYLLPEGNVQICFSGGRTSAYMLHRILEANGELPDRVKVVFTNTGRELPESLDFVQECASRWGVDVVWLEYCRTAAPTDENPDKTRPDYKIVSHNRADRDGEAFMEMIRAKKYLPNVLTRFCTVELKIQTAKRYLMDCGWTKWSSALGIRYDEARRIKVEQPKERWTNFYPLFDDKKSKQDIALFWQKQSFDLKLLGINGRTPLGNCDGCFLKPEWNRAALARDYPERFNWWIEAEKLASSIAAKSSPSEFIINQPYARLADAVKNQRQLFDQEGALCQKSEGECF